MDSSADRELEERVAGGDAQALDAYMGATRDRLRRIVALRMHPALRKRLDASDVVQEACFEAATRYADYCDKKPMRPWLWLRFLTVQKLAQAHRAHLEAQGRDLKMEQSGALAGPGIGDSSRIAIELTDGATAPGERASRQELYDRVLSVLDDLHELDREVLVMRHFEQMNNAEVAEALGIERDAASKRYLRALERLRSVLGL